jgi:hypothetical protein
MLSAVMIEALKKVTGWYDIRNTILNCYLNLTVTMRNFESLHTLRGQMLTSKRYDVSVRKLIDLIFTMTPDERGLLLTEAERIRTKLRATRRNCTVAIVLYYGDKVYPATITNLSFTGAFVECYIPLRIGDSVSVEFKNVHGSAIILNAHIVHASSLGIGIRFNTVPSRAARFLQKCLDDYR